MRGCVVCVLEGFWSGKMLVICYAFVYIIHVLSTKIGCYNIIQIEQ